MVNDLRSRCRGKRKVKLKMPPDIQELGCVVCVSHPFKDKMQMTSFTKPAYLEAGGLVQMKM